MSAVISEASHQSDWDSVVACHRSEKVVTTWNYNRFTMGDHKLLHDRFEKERQFHNVTATVSGFCRLFGL